MPFPACDKRRGVIVRAGQDCLPFDSNVGNGAEIDIVGGRFRGSNLSAIGQGCGDLTIKADTTKAIAFGHYSQVAVDLCAPRAQVKLGGNDQLTGRFVGDRVSSNSNNVGHVCCH